MKKRRLLFSLIMVFGAVFLCSFGAYGQTDDNDWVISISSSVTSSEREALCNRYDLEPLIDLYYRTDEATAKELLGKNLVETAEPSGLGVLCDMTTSASYYNDTHFDEQWAFSAVNIEDCWRYYSKGSKDVTVCVIDSGFYYEHEDATRNYVAGKDYVLSTKDQEVINTYDDASHGTSCAGLLGADTNNELGIAGICKDITVVIQRAFYYDKEKKERVAKDADLAAAIKDAVDVYQADVISMSFLCDDSPYLKAACQYAAEKGVILCAAAGNNAGTGSALRYPAAYDGVIGVAAVDEDLNAAIFSARNSSVDCSAPGVDVLTLGNPASNEDTGIGKYRKVSGTSLATPFVAGLAVMVKSLNPEINGTDFMELLKVSCHDLGDAGYDMAYGYGLVDYTKMMKAFYDRKDDNIFDDVSKEKWYYRPILDVYHKGLMVGVDKTVFGPNATLTRGMLATVIYRMAGSPEYEAACPFEDVDAGEWYYSAVTWCVENKIVYGRSETVFDPTTDISRQEMMVILYRYFNLYLKEPLKDLGKDAHFTDEADIADWAKDGVMEMVRADVISGFEDGSLRPFEGATRAQTASIISGLTSLDKTKR